MEVIEVLSHGFKSRNQHLQDVPGFKALRFLRPVVKGDITLSSRYGTVDKLSMIGKIHKHMRKLIKRGTQKGVDHRIVNRDLSYNIRIELESLNN